MIKKITITVVVIILIITLMSIAEKALQNHEKTECIKWQGWAQEYPNFYLTEWQEEQCNRHQIKVEVPVKTLPALEEPKYREIFATIYAYNSEVEQTDANPFMMASGNIVYDGAIACPEFIAFGTKVEIKGKKYTCEDRMGEKYRDKNYFDIWMTTKEQAKEWGKVGSQVKIYDYN